MRKGQVDIITMGCSKNLVDSELLKKQLEANGYTCKHDATRPQGEIVVINTCGFIADAKEESIQTILDFAQAKDEGRINRLYVMGCLSQRYLKDLQKEIPQVDRYYGKFDYMQLLHDLGKREVKACAGVRSLTTPSHYAYLKISEGCDRHCAYCAIPIITGRHQSRPKADILQEVRRLVSEGVSEFQVIAQELTYYGLDLDGKRHIADLISDMADIPGVEWIRLHYAYPHQFPMELLDVMREKPNVCRYLDIALQHISNSMLERMHRHVTCEETMELIRQLRAAVPGIHIRTTLMVGFPGETDEDFEQLLEFTRWARFERMGAFAYSEEEDTYSGIHYEDDVPEDVKQERLGRLMDLQQQISEEIQAAKVGTVMRVVIDRREGDYYIGRTEFSSPEVDPEVLIPAEEKRLYRGRYYQVLITDSDEFDLYGTVVGLKDKA
ncbi:MAG: 30S ribosomal protein S12 methylthiotransferase RimO [Prevotella sp.]|nr:30S ribosomal protein S12 methylthiotransferase RimO [Prevotella sp.]